MNNNDTPCDWEEEMEKEEKAIIVSLISTLNSLLEREEIAVQSVEELFDDIIYIKIFQTIIKEDFKFKFSGQRSKENRVSNINKILNYFSSVFELDLTYINPVSIVIEKKYDVVKYILSLFINIVIYTYEKEGNEVEEDNVNMKEVGDNIGNIETFKDEKDEEEDEEKEEGKEEEDNNNNNINSTNNNNNNINNNSSNNNNNNNTINNNNTNNINCVPEGKRFSFSQKNEDIKLIPPSTDRAKSTNGNQMINDISNTSRNLTKEHNTSYNLFDNIHNSHDIKKEIIIMIKQMYPSNVYKKISSSPKFNSQLSMILTKVIQMHSQKFPNQQITKAYIATNKKEISKLIRWVIKQNSVGNILLKIVNEVLNNKPVWKKVLEKDCMILRTNIKYKKLQYLEQKGNSEQHIERVRDIYLTALQWEGQRCLEEKDNQNEIMCWKEERMWYKNEQEILFWQETKEYLEEQERYERFKREKERRIRKLKIDSLV